MPYGSAVYGTSVYGGTAAPEPGDPSEFLPVVVEAAFGFSPGVEPGPSDWIDLSEWVDLTPSSTAVSALTGRDNVRAGITPGAVTFELEDPDGRFNPRNTAGPYYGNLTNGTPIRVRAGAALDELWTGWVDSGWPQQITSRRPTVSITAHDLFGLIAQGDAPRSTWAHVVSELAPAHWWRPGVDGWTDAITGATMRHTGVLTQAQQETDSIIDGDELPFGQADVDGYGETTDPTVRLDTRLEAITVLARFKFPTLADRQEQTGGTTPAPIVIIAQDGGPYYTPLRIQVQSNYVIVEADGDGTVRNAFGDPGSASLIDGHAHTIVVHVPPAPDDVRLWIDGRELTLATLDGPSFLGPMTLGALRIGHDPRIPDPYPFTGYLDPVVVWRGLTAGELPELVTSTHDAAVRPWVGQRLDERLSAIVTAMGLGAHIGALDVSGIVTYQGYRQARPLELLQTIEDTEQGRVWIDRLGRLRFSARRWSWADTASTVVQLTLSDDPTLLDAGDAYTMLEDGTEVVDDPLNIVNVAAVTSTNGREQRAENAASIALYRRRGTVQLSGLLHPTDRQSRAVAEWLVLSQAEPEIQVRTVSFRVDDDPDVLGPIALELEEGSLLRIVKLTAAETLDLYAHVIAVRHSFTFTGWTVTLTLDSTRTGFESFAWGSSEWDGPAGWSFVTPLNADDSEGWRSPYDRRRPRDRFAALKRPRHVV
jgi:hypothetical protein